MGRLAGVLFGVVGVVVVGGWLGWVCWRVGVNVCVVCVCVLCVCVCMFCCVVVCWCV